MTHSPAKLVLASGSPRRKEILSSLGITFDAMISDIDESPLPLESPPELALRLAKLKSVGASRETGGLWTIGADTVVDVDGVPLGKPRDRDDALRMLRSLAGRMDLVHTGVAVAASGNLLTSATETTKVFFGDLCDDGIRDFVQSGDGDDKAGAYAIQGRGALLVERIEGCYYNVVGLPAFRLYAMLREIGFRDVSH